MSDRKVAGALAFVATLLLSAAADAQVFRAYLASHGADGPACSLAAPCRLLPAALVAVADGGEIWMLDSANYNGGPVNIAKSVTILAVPGALGSVVATGGNAINIGTPGVKVALRNLVIVPLPGAGGSMGISMYAGTMLTVENCLFANLPQMGIYAENGVVVRVTDSIFRDNGGDGVALKNGVHATITGSGFSGNGGSGVALLGSTPGLTTSADITDSTMDGNFYGLRAASTDATSLVNVSVRDSRAVRNTFNGMIAESSGAAVTITASNNIIASNNGAGIEAFAAGSKVWASGNTVAGNNGTGLRNSGGLFESAGNNAVRNNAQDTFGTITPVAPR